MLESSMSGRPIIAVRVTTEMMAMKEQNRALKDEINRLMLEKGGKSSETESVLSEHQKKVAAAFGTPTKAEDATGE